MRVRCGWKGPGAALILVAVAGAAAISPTRPAGAAANYHGVATADAARVTVIVPNAPATSSIVDTGLTSAQAVVTSGGTSKAFGSNPYPGDNAVRSSRLYMRLKFWTATPLAPRTRLSSLASTRTRSRTTRTATSR